MKAFIAVLVLGSVLASAQVTYINGSFVCSQSDARYCAGDSLATNIIIRCSGTTGQPGNCNDNLAGIPPVGVKSFAPCYQSSPTAGDAACSFDGTVYPEDDSDPFPVPSGGRDDDSGIADGSSSYGGTMTTLVSHFTTGTITNTYTVTVPCSTTTGTPVSSPHEPSPPTLSSVVSIPSPPTIFTYPTYPPPSQTVTEHQPTPTPPIVPSETHPSSPPSIVPSETHPPPPPPPVSPSPPATPSPPFSPSPPGVSSSPPPLPPPVPTDSPPASTITSITVVQPTPTSAPPAPPAGTPVTPATTTGTTGTAPPQFTGAAAALGKHGSGYWGSFAEVGMAVMAVAVIGVV